MAAALLSCLAAAALRPHALGAQDSPLLHEPVSAAAALKALALHKADPVGRALAGHRIRAMLSQQNRPYPQATLDSLADGLARLTIEAPPRDFAAIEALAALSLAGSATTAAVPYARAFELLVRIYKEAPHSGFSAAAMSLVYDVDPERAVRFWAEVAQGNPPRHPVDAETAVDLLANRGGERGRAILRELHARDLVREPGARAYLRWLASRNFVPLSPGQPKDTGAARAPERRPLPPRRR